ncbi:hypothetical protein GYB57_01205 [bacterium]|nr:hypothetical protein [bacterium]
MLKTNTSFIVDILKYNSFISKIINESLKSLALGSSLFIFFSFLIYFREGQFSQTFFLEMIFPILFYFFAFLFRDFYLVPHAVNSVIVEIELYDDQIEIQTSKYDFFLRSLKSKKIILKRDSFRVSKGDFFIKFKEYNDKTTLLKTKDKKFYILTDLFPNEIKEFLNK